MHLSKIKHMLCCLLSTCLIFHCSKFSLLSCTIVFPFVSLNNTKISRGIFEFKIFSILWETAPDQSRPEQKNKVQKLQCQNMLNVINSSVFCCALEHHFSLPPPPSLFSPIPILPFYAPKKLTPIAALWDTFLY